MTLDEISVEAHREAEQAKAAAAAAESADHATKAKEKQRADLAAKSTEGFMSLLTRKFGNLGKAWKYLDPEGRDKLGYVHFAAAARNVPSRDTSPFASASSGVAPRKWMSSP